MVGHMAHRTELAWGRRGVNGNGVAYQRDFIEQLRAVIKGSNRLS